MTYLQHGLHSGFGYVDEQDGVGAVGCDADEFVGVVVEGHVVYPRVPQPEEDRGVGGRVAAQVGGDHHVVPVAEQRSQHAAESHLQWRQITFSDMYIRVDASMTSNLDVRRQILTLDVKNWH